MANLVARQDFEGAGTPSGWTIDTAAGGTIDFDYATSPAPLTGSESLYMTATTATAITVLPTAFSASSTVDCYFKLNVATYPATVNTMIFQIRDASNNVLCALTVSNSVARFKLTHGATTVNGTADLSSGQTYHVWIDYTAGTGADGTANLYYSTASTKPGAANIAVTTGTETASATNIFFRTESRGYDPIIIDDLIAESVIGDAGPAGGSAPTISSTSNPKAGETATITVDDSTGVTSATYGGIALTSVATPTGTTVTGVMPVGGLALGSSNSFTVTNGFGTSAGFADVYEARTGYSFFTSTADATAFNSASPWYNLAGMVTGDQVEYELALDPSSGITITSVDPATGLPTLSASITVDNVSSYYVWDASDTYSVGTIGTINWQETVAPTISTMVIDASGNLVVTLSETVTAGLDGFNGFTVTGFSGGAVTFTYSSGDTTSALTLTASRSIYSNEGNGTGAYTQPGDGVQDESALNNVLATASGVTVTNNSALIAPGSSGGVVSSVMGSIINSVINSVVS